MKAPSPAFSLYPKDILSDEHCAAMTHEEFGMYVRLLMHAWIEGSVPADPVRLARVLRVRHQTFSRCWPAISPCFEERDNRLFQSRLERERSQQRERSARAAANGRKGGRSMKSADAKSYRLATGNPSESFPSPSPSPSPSATTTNEQNGSTRPSAAPEGSRPQPRPNPLVAGRRSDLERELLSLVRQLARHEDRDPTEVLADLSRWDGRSVVNPASMTDDRLVQTLHAARTRAFGKANSETREPPPPPDDCDAARYAAAFAESIEAGEPFDSSVSFAVAEGRDVVTQARVAAQRRERVIR